MRRLIRATASVMLYPLAFGVLWLSYMGISRLALWLWEPNWGLVLFGAPVFLVLACVVTFKFVRLYDRALNWVEGKIV